MGPSAHGTAEAWDSDLTRTAPDGPWDPPRALEDDQADEPTEADATDQFEASTWQRGVALEASDGLSGRGIVVVSCAAAAGCAALDMLLTGGRLTFFFDLCFVVICLVATMAGRRSALFTAGVLPPLVFGGVIAVVAVVAPHAFETGVGVNKVFLTGLADHATGLVFGYAVALVVVAARMATQPRRRSQRWAEGSDI